MSFKVSLSERGQIVIPVVIRKKFKTRNFVIDYEDGKIIMVPSTAQKTTQSLVKKLTEMNEKYAKQRKEQIDVLTEIEKGGA